MRFVTIDSHGEPALAVERQSGAHLLRGNGGDPLRDLGAFLRLTGTEETVTWAI